MGQIEEVEDYGACHLCSKHAETKCTACKKVYYCSRECQKKHWKFHKSECKSLPYAVKESKELGKYLVAAKDIPEGTLLWTETPLVVGPTQDSYPVCLHCYTPCDGSFKCRKSGWPMCGPICEKMCSKNAEVVVPSQTTAEFEIDSYDEPCYLYECIAPLRALLLQKTSPKKFSKVMSMESHFESRKGTESWTNCQNRVIDVMKKTLGIMVFEALCPEYDFTDDTIQKLYGIFETNSVEIRLAAGSEITGLYELTSLLEHSCIPNIRLTFGDDYSVSVKAGRDIRAGEHLSIMYTHSLWGTASRRDHLWNNKKFWCKCPRCEDPSEFGTNFSTLIRNGGQKIFQKNPLDTKCPYTNDSGDYSLPASDVAEEMSIIGAELALLQIKGTITDYESFIEKYGSHLHENHFHMVTAKHSLMQMLGRTDGFLIQDMTEEQLNKKENLCREMIKLCEILDPAHVRLNIYLGVSLFELHLPLLQYGKRKWENGEMPTEDFRKTLREPRECLIRARDLLQDETNAALPEGQLRLQVNDTLVQLEQFMKTVGCDEDDDDDDEDI